MLGVGRPDAVAAPLAAAAAAADNLAGCLTDDDSYDNALHIFVGRVPSSVIGRTVRVSV